MDWVKGFYSQTGIWWGPAEARITDRDHRRVERVHEHAGAGPHRILDIGSGYGTTAAALAQAGHTVTAVEISDRVRFGASLGHANLTVRNEDFYTVELPGEFDVVTYFNGFGVGSDDDQRRLLTRIASEWLAPGGIALIDVYNPFVWAGWHGQQERKLRDPRRGYEYDLVRMTTFDQVTCTATDSWWPAGHPGERISQVLRCYTPADLRLLLGGTGLTLQHAALTRSGQHEYLVRLVRG